MNAAEKVFKPSLIKIIRRWVIISLLILAAILLVIHTIKNYWEAESRAETMRTHYIEDQRKLITYEVNSVVRVIDYEIEKLLQDTHAKVKDRVYKAYSIAQNIYNQYAGTKPASEVQKLIIDALRPIRFDQGSGYYFINDFNGISKLIADRPGLEGTSLIDTRDIRGNYVIRNAIKIAKNQGEGINHYYWTKPGQGKREFEKISFVKRFEPFNWYMGTGVYLDRVESRMQTIISQYVNTNRFGANGQGYVFINELLDINGGKSFARVYANPNRPNDTGKLISDDFQDAKGKMFRREFLNGLREKGECYVDYWYHKIGYPKPSPKTSFFKLAGNGRFIVAAGVYLDDIEDEINRMHAVLKTQRQRSLFIISSIFIAAILITILLFNFLSKRLKSDFDLFVDFFNRAAEDSESIDRDRVRFGELDQLAGFANQMLTKKRKIEEALHKEHVQLEHWISEQERTESELRESEEKYRILVENANDAIYINQEGMLKFCNPVTEKLTGYSKQELSVKPLEEIIHPDDHDAVMAQHEAWMAGKHPSIVYQPFRIVRKDDRPVWVQASVVRVGWEDKPATLNFLCDITEQKELEKKLIQSQKLEAIGTLAGGIAHDFNNILSGLLGYTELALYDVEDMPATKKKLGQVMQAGERAANLVKQILSFSRSSKIERVPVSPLIITKEVIKLIRATIPANIDIKPSLASDSCVLADATQIHQILMNLCTNAAYAMKESGGVLSVSLEDVNLSKKDLFHHFGVAPGDFLKISIEDTGTGMAKDVQEKVFDPFFTTKGPGEGTGMGLASVHGITSDLGGFVSLYSEPGQGTSMNIFLPLITETAEIDCGTGKGPVTGGTERILFVDDEPTQKGLAEDALSRYGYRVSAFLDSTVTMAHFQQNPDAYDLLITDMTMPKMTGDVLIRKIRLMRPDIPVIMCTGYSEVLDERRANELSIDAFLHKPVIITDMLKTIRAVLNKER
jgi:PAS domain S-box-containing protein